MKVYLEKETYVKYKMSMLYKNSKYVSQFRR